MCIMIILLFFQMEVTYFCFNLIKGKYYYTLLPPLNMKKMKNFNLVFKIQKGKTEKNGAVDRLKIAYI